jgi:hypothetical protein
MSGYRQAALALHELNESDRSWILGRIPDEKRAQLSTLLAELRNLGIPAESGFAEHFAAHQEVQVQEPRIAGPRELLRNAKPDRLVHILHGEPAWLVAAVLSIESWSWQEGFLERTGAERRAAIRADMRRHLAPKLAEALVAQLESRFASQPELPATIEVRTESGRLAQAMRRFSEAVRAWLR